MKQIIATPDAPPALGPYAQAVKVGNTVYVSGQLPLDPRSGQIVAGGIAAQTERVLLNLRAILEEAEASFNDVVRITIFMQDLNDFDEMNRVFGVYFPFSEQSRQLPPSRSTVQVARLPRDAALEMDAIAVISEGYFEPELF